MSAVSCLDALRKEYMDAEDAHVHERTEVRASMPVDFDSMFAEDELVHLGPRALHVPEVEHSFVAVADDDADSDDDANSDDDSENDADEQRSATTTKRHIPNYRVSVEELHKRLKWTDKFKSFRRYMFLKERQMHMIHKLQKNGRRFKKSDMSALMKAPKRGDKDMVDQLMYRRKIGWRRRSSEENEANMQLVCEDVASREEFDKYFENALETRSKPGANVQV